ncbi:MAG: transcriptional regulator [Clostridia bacterium]|nr:transcriptional regulator [Clostridia bacterium]
MNEKYETFTRLLTSIGRGIQKIKTEEMATFGLKSSHFPCIYYLYKMNTLTAKELCDICEEDKANMSRTIKHLEENGYVCCYSRTLKRYQCPIRLTEKGREVGRQICERLDSITEALGAGLNDHERAALYKALAVIDTNVANYTERYESRIPKIRWREIIHRLKHSSSDTPV